mgnify:CR=1 FL=1
MGDKPQDPWKGTPEERLAAYWRKRAGISFSDFDALMGREDVTGEGKAQVRMAAVDLAAQPSAKLADVKRALVTLHIKSLPYTRQQYYMALALGVIEGDLGYEEFFRTKWHESRGHHGYIGLEYCPHADCKKLAGKK